MFKKLILIVALLTITINNAQLRLPAFFADHMVLQRNEKASIWGIDKANTTIDVKGSWGEKSTVTTDKNGYWKLKIQTPEAGGPYTLSIKGSEEILLNNVMIGEVWLCSGQSNMEMPVKGFKNQPINGSNEAILNANNPEIRLFTVKRNSSLEPLQDVSGNWSVASPLTVQNFSATAYFFGKKLHDLLNVPIGLINSSWGASNVETWMDKQMLSEFKHIKIPSEIPKTMVQQKPTIVYNAMMNPLVGYTMKGVIWYQGESNRNRASDYKLLFPKMITSWRAKWQQGNFPFYFVQIAPFGYKDGNAGFIREAQLYTMQTVKNTGMAVSLDIGDCGYIHPREKKHIGDRLANWALAKNYGFEGIAFSGPVYTKMEKTDGGKLILFFNHTENGLSSFGQELVGFEIAGEDREWHPAKVTINRDKTITVWAPEVKTPLAARYAFKNCVQGTLFNTAGLPASSFRTDTWTD